MFITQLEVCRMFLINVKNFHSLKVECDNSNANGQQNVSLLHLLSCQKSTVSQSLAEIFN